MKFLLFSILFYLVSPTALFAQNPASAAVKTFDKDGLRFDYPADWALIDKSTPQMQNLTLAKDNSTVLIVISSPREVINEVMQYRNLQTDSYARYTKAVAKSLESSNKEAQEAGLCLDLNGRKISGTRYTGFYKNEAATGEVYPFALGNRFLTLVYMRADKDGAAGNAAWNTVVNSLSLAGSNKQAAPSSVFDENYGGVLNGKALKLVRPVYSKEEYRARAWGEVEVQVEVDETGKITSAKAISGNKLLYYNSEHAAKMSKFAPTMICGKAIKVTGIIIYNFAPNR
jgi:hypothetical protein